MSHLDNVIDIRRPVEFMIDDNSYATTARRQLAGDLLILAGLDPSRYELTELRRHRPRPVRYENTDIVEIHKGSRFFAVRDRADVV